MASARRHLAHVCVLAITAAALASCGGSGAVKPAAATGVAGPSEVTAEPVSSAGQNPFTAPAGKDMKGLTPPPGVTAASGPPTYQGSLPGLYGGTLNYATCDAAKLVSFLEANPDKAAAWAGVLGISTTQISSYVSHLTPVLLRTDTRVTNHGYANGRATTLQSVLEAGTAVFVNRYGEPVVKCYCGNPLTPPTLYQAPVYVGPRWTTFETTHVTIIRQSIKIIRIYTLYDPATQKTFERPAGTSGTGDLPAGITNLPPAMAAPATPPSTPGTPPPTSAQPPSGTPPTQTPSPQQQTEQPAANFSPNPGHQGDNFVLSASGFRPGAHLDVTLTRPDGVVEHYTIDVASDGSGSHTFTNTHNVVTGTYNATVANPATGAQAQASLQVQPSGGP
jgi:hypothetical protein